MNDLDRVSVRYRIPITERYINVLLEMANYCIREPQMQAAWILREGLKHWEALTEDEKREFAKGDS